METDKKVHLNSIDIILGTRCNLNCRHCAGGKPKNMTIQEKYIDDLLDNLTGICTLAFSGYEISFYKNEIKMIFDKIKSRNINVDTIRFFTNAVFVDEELAEIFNDFRYNYTTHPKCAEFRFSNDKFHFNNGFTKEKLEENIKRYKTLIGDCLYYENNLDQGLSIRGNAKELKLDDIKDIDSVMIPHNGGCNYCEFRTSCKGEGLICKGAKNCIVNPITLSPDGYIYGQDIEAFASIAEDNHLLALGHISEQSLFDIETKLIEDNQKSCRKTSANFQGLYDSPWQTRYVFYHYILVREKMLEACKSRDSYIFADAVISYKDLRRQIVNTIDKFKSKNLNTDDLYSCLSFIGEDYNELNEICSSAFRFSIYGSHIANIDKIERIYNRSFFAPNNFIFDYKKFKELWECYYNCDFNRFRELTNELEEKSLAYKRG